MEPATPRGEEIAKAWAQIATLTPVSLDTVADHLRVTFRLYMAAEPDGDVHTFLSWVRDETGLSL